MVEWEETELSVPEFLERSLGDTGERPRAGRSGAHDRNGSIAAAESYVYLIKSRLTRRCS